MNNLEEYEECSTWSRDFSIPPSLSWSRLPVQPLKFVTAHLFEWEKDEMAVPYLNQGRQRLQLAGLQWLAEKYRNSSTLMLLESKSKFKARYVAGNILIWTGLSANAVPHRVQPHITIVNVQSTITIRYSVMWVGQESQTHTVYG